MGPQGWRGDGLKGFTKVPRSEGQEAEVKVSWSYEVSRRLPEKTKRLRREQSSLVCIRLP